ncbi:hypothetical protein TIFTF001_015544 [Ficus carica]|uniref:Uncharacterized protein n=1 Tax=Ficus carica TaxID=3494 RepID=A0AA88ASG8_FICCA|nr:hypothetical protein TIFTF001_015544 [Ficus carica]
MSWSSELTELDLSPTALKKMVNLRILKFRNRFLKRKLQFRQGLQFLPDALRYLYWDGYPFESLPPEFSGKNLVELKMQYSNVKQLWEGIQCLENLKAIDLSYSEQLIQVPDLSGAPNIESVTLRYCVHLQEVPSYFGSLQKLTSLNLKGCSSLVRVSALPENVINVNLKRCESLESLPSNICTLKSLRRLKLAGCSKFESSKELLKFLDNLKYNLENLN